MQSSTLTRLLSGFVVIASACNPDEKSPAPPPPPVVAASPSQPPLAPPTTGVAVTSTSASTQRFSAGDKVSVYWGRRWYPATVLAVRGPDSFKVHYDNYGSKWDEVVGGRKIKAR